MVTGKISQNSLRCISNGMFFSYQLCLLGLYVTSNVVKLMFIAYFSLLSITMMVISVCEWHCAYYICSGLAPQIDHQSQALWGSESVVY